MTRSVLFDLDGTLADNEHRRHFISGEEEDWRSYNDRMAYDRPNRPIVELAQELHAAGYPLIMVTGREEKFRTVSLDWLDLQHVPCDGLYMRATGDFRDDSVVKSELLDQIIAAGFKPWLVVDDRKRVVDMWRQRGLTCLQCAAGEF